MSWGLCDPYSTVIDLAIREQTERRTWHKKTWTFFGMYSYDGDMAVFNGVADRTTRETDGWRIHVEEGIWEV
jgi:hypothetical protein